MMCIWSCGLTKLSHSKRFNGQSRAADERRLFVKEKEFYARGHSGGVLSRQILIGATEV